MDVWKFQEQFDLTIGRLDRVLSLLVGWGRLSKQRNELHSQRQSQLTQPCIAFDRDPSNAFQLDRMRFNPSLPVVTFRQPCTLLS